MYLRSVVSERSKGVQNSRVRNPSRSVAREIDFSRSSAVSDTCSGRGATVGFYGSR